VRGVRALALANRAHATLSVNLRRSPRGVNPPQGATWYRTVRTLSEQPASHRPQHQLGTRFPGGRLSVYGSFTRYRPPTMTKAPVDSAFASQTIDDPLRSTRCPLMSNGTVCVEIVFASGFDPAPLRRPTTV